MNVNHRTGNIPQNGEPHFPVESVGRISQLGLQIAALHELGDNVDLLLLQLQVRVESDAQELNDVGMLHLREGAGFSLEVLDEILVPCCSPRSAS